MHDIQEQIILFIKKGCINCKVSKLQLDKADIFYMEVDVEETPETALDFGIVKTPALVVYNGKNYVVYDNASEIRKYIESIK